MASEKVPDNVGELDATAANVNLGEVKAEIEKKIAFHTAQ
jgi:hypothetical protein